MYLFDPSRWPHRELLARIVGLAAVTGFLVHRVMHVNFAGIATFYEFHGYPPERVRLVMNLWRVIWGIESGIFIGYIAAFLTRSQAKSVAKGFWEVVFPLMLGALPFVIVNTPYNFSRWMPPRSEAHLPLLVGILGIVILGVTINMVGLFTLRRAFTIMTEARTLIRGGLFRFVRHPLYAGQFVLYFGYTLLHLHWFTVLLYVTFVAAQFVRARNEERKLAGVFPEYEEYRRKTGMFFPKLRHNLPE